MTNRKTVSPSMALTLFWLWHRRRRWCNFEEAPEECRGFERLVEWGLIERKNESFYRLSPLGKEFVKGKATVPRYINYEKGGGFRFDGEPVTIRDSLRGHYRYEDLI